MLAVTSALLVTNNCSFTNDAMHFCKVISGHKTDKNNKIDALTGALKVNLKWA